MKIENCPFCGGEAAIGTGPNYSFVNCTQCLASTNLLNAEGIQPDESDAIAAWNARAGGWRPIETMPEDIKGDQEVLLYLANGGQKVDIYFGPRWKEERKPLYWQPLPAPPTEASK